MLSLYMHSLHWYSPEEVLREELPKFLFVCFPLAILRYGSSFCRLCVSQYAMTKSHRKHQMNVLTKTMT